MTLPIIIMLERHWDAAAKSALKESIEFLQKYGYNTLCFEAPSDEIEDVQIQSIKSTISFIKEQLNQTVKLLESRGIPTSNLLSMDFSSLSKLLQLFVSSRHYNEMALWFKELPGHIEKLKLIEHAKEFGFSINGIDLKSDNLSSLRSMEVNANLSKKIAVIDSLDDERTTAFKFNLQSLQNLGKGVVFVVGHSHYEKLLSQLHNDYYAGELMFIHPHSSKTLDNSIDCSHLGLESSSSINLDVKLSTHDDIKQFVSKFEDTVKNKTSSFYEEIEPTTTTMRLREKSSLEFHAFKRESLYVDAIYTPKDDESIQDRLKQLTARNIKCHITFFGSKSSIVVPCINDEAVAKNISIYL